jgi:hypothetical protein
MDIHSELMIMATTNKLTARDFLKYYKLKKA